MDSAAPVIQVRGIIQHALFRNEEGTFAVVDLSLEPGSGRERAAGNFNGCQVGDSVEITGRREVHPKFGNQIRVVSCRWVPPTTADGIARFLGRGELEGIGPTLARRIVQHFGSSTLDVLDYRPERLREIKGIGKVRLQQIQQMWAAGRQRVEEDAFLAGLGLGPVLTARMRDQFGDETAGIVRRAPYRLAREVEGIGFGRADEIARQMEFAADSPERIEAGLEHTLQAEIENGHVFAPREDLVRQAAGLLSLAPGPVEDRLDRMLASGALRMERRPGLDAVYLPSLRDSEEEVCREFATRLRAPPEADAFPADTAVEWVQPKLGFTLTEDQCAALRLVLSHRVCVLTGGPGVGKTTIVKALCEVYASRGWTFALAAPTGRAARRLQESSGRDASTLHRLLKFVPHLRRFEHDRGNPLPHRVVLIDEASMIDLRLMQSVLQALPEASRLVLIGDADQLPSVGPGDVLRSLVESSTVPTAKLQQILRQREGSSIVRAAHKVLHGEMPEFESQPTEGAFFVERDEAEACRETVWKLVAERLPRQFSLDALTDIQVLTPMNRGSLGVGKINETFQQRLHPVHETEGWLPGDRVMQTRNNYDLQVFNGEIGRVLGFDAEAGTMQVDFEDRHVTYPRKAQGQLTLAYAITVHKSQGCEFPVVVLVLAMQHYRLLQRNLIYTAITRARRVLVVVGSRRALEAAIQSGSLERRRSLLQGDLLSALSP